MGNKDIFDKDDINDIQSEYDSLTDNLLRCNKPGDRELIDKAFRVANEAHWNMRRKSGEPYIMHPLSVAKIVNREIGLGAKSIAVALLHDVVEDTDYSLEDVTRDFNSNIAVLIDGLTKISGTYNNDNSSLQAENFRKMLLTLSDDVRVILIKIADRLHNMRTLDSMPEHKQMKIAGETIFLYAPLANRLGLYAIKSELEDLSFKFRQPKIYDDIAARMKHSEQKYISMINRFAEPIIEKLSQAGFVFEINGRPKSIFSIWNKMQAKNVPFEEVYDLLAVRIVFEPSPGIHERTQCWNIYSIITDTYLPKPDRLRDWVSRPKPNGYEALHVTVMGPDGKWVEVQIRSKRMDEVAERGYAAHWKYKGDEAEENELDKWIKKIRHTLENPLEDPIEFLDEFKMNLFSSEIVVYTPKGLLISLPKGASALDFAYEIHTEVGNRAIGAKINFKLNPINTILMSGDQVEIITSDIAKPDKEWLSFVRTSKAKLAIRNALRGEAKDFLQQGMEILESKLNELGLALNNEIIKNLIASYEVLTREELFSGIGQGKIKIEDLRKFARKSAPSNVIKYWELKLIGSKKEKKEIIAPDKGNIDRRTPYLLRENVDRSGQSYEIAKCCNPIPGDEVTGYHSPEGHIVIHKPKCPVAIRIMANEGNRIIAVKWAIHKLVSFLARISMTGIDRIGLVNDITKIISSELQVNMNRINITTQNGIFEGTIDLYVHHIQDLNNLIMKISNVNGIENIKRVEDFS